MNTKALEQLIGPRTVRSFLVAFGHHLPGRFLVRSFAFAIGVGVLSVLFPRSYQAEGTFLPDLERSTAIPSSLAGLASQFNLSNLVGTGQRVDFYGDLVTSRTVLDSLADSPLPTQDPSRTITPVAWFDYSALPAPRALSKTREKLKSRINVQVNQATGIVRIRFQSEDPVFGAAVVNRLISLVNDFNLVRYRSRARARREFTEERLDDASTELRDAEVRQADFAKRNRAIESSPELRLEADRLSRAVRVREQVFLQLTQSLEDARIEEVRDTPILTVVDGAVPPTRPSFPQPILYAVLTFFLLLTITVGRRIVLTTQGLQVQAT
jgi:uncharacterized protein involved in exopolysaccharide biosynthesis